MRLQHGGAYTSDVSTLRAQIRANGTRENIGIINISHPFSNRTVNLYINLAYQPNGNLPCINGSLYTIGFGNGNGIWHFNVGNIGVVLPGNLIPGALTGDYGSLGYPAPGNLPNITDANLLAAVNAVATYTGAAPLPSNVLAGITRLIIAVNEAVRFDSIESGINKVLGPSNSNEYAPPFELVHNWGGHILGS